MVVEICKEESFIDVLRHFQICQSVFRDSLNSEEMSFIPCDSDDRDRHGSICVSLFLEFKKMAVGSHIWAMGDLSLGNGFMQIK